VLIAAAAVLVGLAVVQGISFEAGVLYRHGTYTSEQGSAIWGGNESNPGSPVRIKLGISSPPSLGNSAELLAVVSSAMDASDVEAHIRLPNGFAMISGSADWKGNIQRDQSVELRYVIKSVQVGDWVIEGFVKWIFAEGSFYTDSDRIYIIVTESSARVVTTTFSETSIPTLIPVSNNSLQPPSAQINDTKLPPAVSGGQLLMFVSPTLVVLGVETTITVSYGVSLAPGAPGVIVRGGAPSFEGPAAVTYGPVVSEDGAEWIAKIRPTSLGVIKVNGQDESGAVHVSAEISVVNDLPPPADQPSMSRNRYDTLGVLALVGVVTSSLIAALATLAFSRSKPVQVFCN
jgi:hypothetical protein